jgi:hypothetical protein
MIKRDDQVVQEVFDQAIVEVQNAEQEKQQALIFEQQKQFDDEKRKL